MSHSDNQATSLPPTPIFIRDLVRSLLATPTQHSEGQYRKYTSKASSSYFSQHLYDLEKESPQATDRNLHNCRFNLTPSSQSSASISTKRAFTPAEPENKGKVHTICLSSSLNTQTADNMEGNSQGFPNGQGPPRRPNGMEGNNQGFSKGQEPHWRPNGAEANNQEFSNNQGPQQNLS